MDEKTIGTIVQRVLSELKAPASITLEQAKRLCAAVEEESAKRGQASVIAVCNPQGNPVLVHVMDGAFLVSFDVAVKKAWTAVAVKVSTMELARLAQPGQTFFGIDRLGDGRICILGGGVPLKVQDRIIGGFAVSGGTGEVDDELARFGAEILETVL